MAKYVFDPDQVLTIKDIKTADPQKIGEALEVISKKSGGKLTPTAVVHDARDKKHVLNKHFEWDNKLAANAYRIEQARSLIRCIHVEDSEVEGAPPRAFLSIKEKDGISYRTLSDVLSSEDLQQRLLTKAEADLLAWELRYKQIEDVCEMVRSARELLAAKRRSRRDSDDSRPTA